MEMHSRLSCSDPFMALVTATLSALNSCRTTYALLVHSRHVPSLGLVSCRGLLGIDYARYTVTRSCCDVY